MEWNQYTPNNLVVRGYNYIKNNAWVTVNNDVWVTSEAICQYFSRVTKSRVKIIGKSHHEWPKHRYSQYRMYYFISYTLFDVLNTKFRQHNYRSLISLLSLRRVFSDLVLWRHHSWSVTSRECRTLALWRHIRWLFLHAQIGAKAIFTSE